MVELLISLGLFGLASVVLASVVGENAKQMARARAENALESSITESTNAIEILLSNTTRTFACGCGDVSGTACVFDSGATNPDMFTDAETAGDAGHQLLVFEAEDSASPLDEVAANCYLASENGAGPKLRGCKHVFELRFFAPTVRGTSGPYGQPGRLVLNQCNSFTAPATCDSATRVSTMNGVYSVRCGHPQAPADPSAVGVQRPDYGTFRMDVSAKAVLSFQEESWSPNESEIFRFRALGLHRSMSIVTEFRNLNNRGIHYGKVFTNVDCVRDGQPDTGSKCCSGFSREGVCLSAESCVRSAGTPTVQTADAYQECCSHQTVDDAGTIKCI